MNKSEQKNFPGLLILLGIMLLAVILREGQWNWWLPVAVLIIAAGGILHWQKKAAGQAEEKLKEKWKENGMVEK